MTRQYFETEKAFRDVVANNKTIGNEIDLCDVVCSHGDVQGAIIADKNHKPFETLVLCEKCYESHTKQRGGKLW